MWNAEVSIIDSMKDILETTALYMSCESKILCDTSTGPQANIFARQGIDRLISVAIKNS